MKCNFLPFNNNYHNKNKTTSNCSPTFGTTPEKLIKKILATKNNKDIKVTFDEMVKIYNHLGYDVLMKRGSHAIVPVGKLNIPLVIPHKDKYIHPNDIKRFKLILEGKAEKAQLV